MPEIVKNVHKALKPGFIQYKLCSYSHNNYNFIPGVSINDVLIFDCVQ